MCCYYIHVHYDICTHCICLLPSSVCVNPQDFLTKYSESNLQFSDSNINFGRHQILECARDALEKSRENTLSKDQVISMCSNLEGTLVEVRPHSLCIM